MKTLRSIFGFGSPMALVHICRPSKRPKEAADALEKMGIKDVSLVNKLEVLAKADGDEHEIVLLGAVGKSWWDDSGIGEQEFRDALKSIPNGKKITISINSEGGSVKEGLGIYNAIKERNADIKVRIAGYALSIASVIPLAAKKSVGGRGVVSPNAAIWMEHEAWTWASGNKAEMRKTADMLEAHDETLVDIYAKATGKSKDDVRKRMAEETWTKGSAAVDAGLADESEDGEDASASYRPLHPDYILSCKSMPQEILNALRVQDKSAAPKPAGNEPKTNNTMNKKLLVALLTTHGINNATTGKPFTETDADADFEAALSSMAAASKKPEAKKEEPKDELAEIRKEIKAAKDQRLRDKIEAYVADGKITKAEVPIFVAAAHTDEAGTIAILDAKEVQTPGGVAVTFDVTEHGPEAMRMNKDGIHGNKIIPELANIFAANKTREERFATMAKELPTLLRIASRRDGGVMAANTFSATVTTNFLIAGCTQKISNLFAAANLFTTDADSDPFKPLAVGIRKFNTTSTDGSQVQTNATDFEGLGAGGDSTIDPITITPAQYTSGGHLTNAQLNSGFRIGDIIEKKLIDLAAKVTVANFTTNAPLVSAAAAFGFSDLATMQGVLKKCPTKNAILDGEYRARISNIPTNFQPTGTVGGPDESWQAYGWNRIALNTDWSGAGANVRGFAGGPEAVGIISGLPLNPPEGIPGNIVAMGVAQLPGVNLAIATYAWFSPSSRTFYFTYDIIAGATLLDETAGMLVKDA
jgi:ATP-dependent Clp protease protease subunit